jgi:sialidase-1
MKKLAKTVTIISAILLMYSCGHISNTKTFSKHLWKNSDKEYTKYRIPSMIVTQKGTVLTFCEGRAGDGGDAEDIDLLVKRSTDNGETWSELAIVWDDGGNTCGNPCPVIDQTTGRIILMMTWNLVGNGEDLHAIMKEGDDTRRPFMCYSDDDGLTWSEPEDLTATCKNPDWGWYATGPGIGIQLKSDKYKNRIVIPANYSYSTKNETEWGFKSGIGLGAHVLLSDDGGATWRMSKSITPRCNESQMVELSDGRLMMNMRSYNGMGCRAISYSEDGGETWSKIEHALQLVEPVCQASIIEYGQYDGKKMYLFSNPSAVEDRVCMTIKTSFDECKTWSNAKLIFNNKAEYSCLTVLPNGNIGLLYEVGLVEEDWKDKGIVFVSIHPDDLFKPDTLLDNLNLE